MYIIEGRPKVYGKKQIEHALELLQTNSYRQVEEVTGISKSTLIRAKRNITSISATLPILLLDNHNIITEKIKEFKQFGEIFP